MPFGPRARSLALASVLAATSFVARPAGADTDAPQTTRVAGGYMGVGLEAEADGTLRVVSVVPSSPASAAGIVPGDMIVRARGGTPGSVDTFTMSVRAAGPGTEYPLDLRRGARPLHVTVRLGNSPQQGVTIGQPPPVMVSQVVMGSGPGDLEQLRGRVVILDFWASWCGPCRMVMPVLNQMHQRYAAQGLTVLGVTDEPASTARLVGQQMSIQYTLATEQTAQTRFGVRNLPTMVVLDRRGNVRRVTVGVDANEMRTLDHLVQQLLAEPATP